MTRDKLQIDVPSKVLRVLEQWGLLLLQDAAFPSLVGLVAGKNVRGSWWGHPKGKVIFHAAEALDDDPDVATAKLISGKVTFVHRRLWPQLIAIGRSREAWQTQGLTKDARDLLARVDKEKCAQASGRPARLLETRLLVASRQVHTESGVHATELSTWERFARRTKVRLPRISAERARNEFEEVVLTMNVEFGATVQLPWNSQTRSKAR